MYQEEVVLCSASHYAQKYYLNEDFNGLPEQVKKELQVMCVLFTEDVGGVIAIKFNSAGELEIETEAYEEDLLYDEIGSVLKVKQMRKENQELFEQLETYYRVFMSEDED